ncbi:MAG TPA: glycosyltransferase family 4 protein [Chloroflexota bacterium]|nr:glycosyltransferase family 4 protein [Chloroflexota bacterium]
MLQARRLRARGLKAVEARSSGRHIVFVSLAFHPDTSATSMLFTDLFRRMGAGGTRVTVLCGFPARDPASSRVLPRNDRLGSVEIHRCGPRIAGKRSLASRAVAYLLFLAHACWRLALLGDRVMVVGGTDPPFTAVALWLLSRVRRITYQCLILDVYPDGLVALGRLRERSVAVRIWRAANRRSFRHAARVLVIGRDMRRLLCRDYGVEPARVDYVPHWAPAETEAAAPPPRGRLLEDLGIERCFVVQYSGNMGLWHDIEGLVRAAHHLRLDRGIHFLLIGNGRRRGPAEALARGLGLTNVTWLNIVPRCRLPVTLASCDAALISFRPGLAGVAVPSKLYGVLASGRPVLAQVPDDSEVAYVVREERCGLVVPPGDAGALAEAIRTLASDRDLTAAMAANAFAAYRRTYTLAHATARFDRIWNLS